MNSHYLNLDDAWNPPPNLPTLDARPWGPRLRYLARARDIEEFRQAFAPRLAPFVLTGSGDFHHLAALFVANTASRTSLPLHVLSFDNHPDWDIRPPRWACGGWLNRILDCSPPVRTVASASVWGCGNFELRFPHCLFRNRAALRDKRLSVFSWHSRVGPSVPGIFQSLTPDSFRPAFAAFARSLAGHALHVTIDLDCLAAAHAHTDWEPGLFAPGDLVWALQTLRLYAPILGGDLCGAHSPATYARPLQRLAARWDHPQPTSAPPPPATNRATLDLLWPALTAADRP